MTELALAADATTSDAVRQSPVVDVADKVIELMRAFTKARNRMLAAAEHDVEWSAHVLLKCLHSEGSMRAGALADCLRSDPSTISRQVAALVREGLLERRADPADGRASLLVLTPKADAQIAEVDQIRNEYIGRLLDGWTQDDVQQFGRLLARFTEAYGQADDGWIRERVANRVASMGGTK